MKLSKIKYQRGYQEGPSCRYEDLAFGQFFTSTDGQLRMKSDSGYTNLRSGSAWPDSTGLNLPQITPVRVSIKVKRAWDDRP